MSEEEVTEQGVIRREEMPFLSQHGTAYALYDEEKESHVCALKSDHYQFREYVGLRAGVTGMLEDVGAEVPLMHVTKVELP
jgi:hypothetical protein